MALTDHPPRTCPTEAELQHFHARELPAEQQTALEAHLEKCSTCALRAAGQLAEHVSWVDRLRSAGVPPAERVISAGPALKPDDVPGYELRDELRRGGQGIVYRAVQLSTKREVALKVLREGRFASAGARKRFEREIEIVASLQHPHVVTIFDSGRTRDGRQFFAMDFIRGRRLDDCCAETAMSRPDRLAVFVQICDAVNYAHQRGVIHRDLKPSNVLVDETGSPHILDFGLARHLSPQETMSATLPGQVPGTLPYLAPEQARGLPDADDVRGDVYALGVMLYELLTGTYPYLIDQDVLQTLKRIAETPPVPPRRVPGASKEAIDVDLETVVLKALAKERTDRYQTAGDLARDLQNYLTGDPVEARRDSGWYLARKALARHRTALTVAVAFVVLVTASAIALGVLYAGQVRLRADAQAAESQARKRFDQLRTLAGRALFEIDPSLAPLPGAAPVRERIASDALEYLDLLVQDAGDDPSLRHELAAAYVTIGEVQGDLQSSSLGDLHGALASYRKAEELLRALLDRTPDFTPAQRTLLLVWLRIADTQRTLGELDDARRTYDDAVELGTQILERDPDHSTTRSHLASAHGRIGNMLIRLKQFDQARTHFETSKRIAAELPATYDEGYGALHTRVATLTGLGELEYGAGRKDAALDAYRAAEEIGREALRRYPDHLTARRSLAVVQQWIGIILTDQRQLDDALASFAASMKLCEDLIAPGAASDTDRTDLARTGIKYGEAQMAAGQLAAALATFQKARQAAETVAARHPDWADNARLLGVVYYKLYEVDQAHGNAAALAVAARTTHREAACDWLVRCRDVFLDMRTRGILAPPDAGVPDELASEIEQCKENVKSLNSS